VSPEAPLASPRIVSVVGACVDVYAHGQAGTHVQFMGGLGSTTSETQSLAAATGLGAGIGYDWITSSTWNVGVLFRSLVLVPQTPTFTPGLLLTGTLR
jgi:hypothetical protein